MLCVRDWESDRVCACVRVCVTSISFSQTVKATHRAGSQDKAPHPPLVEERMSRADNALLSPPPPCLPFLPLARLRSLPSTDTHTNSPLPPTRFSAGGESLKLDLVVVGRDEGRARCKMPIP